MTELFSLKGRTALVTGARSGIGAAIAIALAEAGADLFLHGHHDDLDDTASAVAAHGRSVSIVVADLASPDAAAELARAHTEVDILVNNAGIIRRGPATEVTLDSWWDVFAVNLDSVFAMTQVIGRAMVARRQGKIISIASLLSFQGGLNVSAYAASKHAIAGLTKALSNEWAAHNVQVNAIAPGYIGTDNTAVLQTDPVREPQITQRIPAARWGTPADIAGAAVFLAAPASDYVNGHVLVVDGGWLGR
ncbi:MAG TPA: 2-deoxy-D-gluconate 3-dehydrogenase [Micromonosporaceae bacterium]|nr:2-deoxy-D-gluconate 3-dehydrogenase [Micromonosporaceae bacterium]HCU52279.1 2-deoxy-D-gluconate 3-dehydrogenase [Micromonosporaceae bacterium]